MFFNFLRINMIDHRFIWIYSMERSIQNPIIVLISLSLVYLEKPYIFIRQLQRMSLLIEHLFRYPLSQIYQSYLNVSLSPWLQYSFCRVLLRPLISDQCPLFFILCITVFVFVFCFNQIIKFSDLQTRITTQHFLIIIVLHIH